MVFSRFWADRQSSANYDEAHEKGESVGKIWANASDLKSSLIEGNLKNHLNHFHPKHHNRVRNFTNSYIRDKPILQNYGESGVQILRAVQWLDLIR